MNKKALYISIAALIIIIVIVILGLKSCEPRVKEEPITEDGKTQSDLERLNFINANIEFTCEIIKNPDIKNDKVYTETRVREVFKKHLLPVDSNDSMIAILKKYENDTDISAIIKENVKPCAQGNEPIFVK